MHMPVDNPFASPDVASGYEAWYERTGRRADRLEKALLKRLLARFPRPGSLLEVGCGTGHFTRWFKAQGAHSVGLDRSLSMLAEATRLGGRVCICGDALALPLPSGVFDLVALITTLEFVADPVRALREALRVSRHGLILGVLNRHSLLGLQLKNKGGAIWSAAHLFTPAELADQVRRAAAGKRVEIIWSTTLWPAWPGALPLPFGGFIGMAVTLLERGERET
jgi:ubiquinone/menaquinone biosynthesis C-methylase UbiE